MNFVVCLKLRSPLYKQLSTRNAPLIRFWKQQLKSGKTEKLKSKKRVCSEVSINSPGNPWSRLTLLLTVICQTLAVSVVLNVLLNVLNLQTLGY